VRTEQMAGLAGAHHLERRQSRQVSQQSTERAAWDEDVRRRP
jgi:hypothetical protein